MKIAVFSSKPYDQRYFERYNQDYNYNLSFFDTNLNAQTSNLTQDFNLVCVFLNHQLNEKVIGKLADNGVKLITLSCTGFNNVNI